jgi:hypothetical protein
LAGIFEYWEVQRAEWEIWNEAAGCGDGPFGFWSEELGGKHLAALKQGMNSKFVLCSASSASPFDFL